MHQARLRYGIQFKKGTEWSYEHARKREKIWMVSCFYWDNHRLLFSSICKHRFAQPTSLQKHQRVHDNLKPFSCEEPGCSLIFSMKSNLRRHVRNLHTGVEPSFECDICQDSFKTKNNLQQHGVKHMEKVSNSRFIIICGLGWSRIVYLHLPFVRQSILPCSES